MDFVINNRNALNRVRSERSLRRTIRRIKIGLHADNVNVGELESRINNSYFSCGCQSGALAVHAALVIAGATWLFTPDLIDWVWWKVALVAFLAGLVGKFAGLTFNRFKLNQALVQLEAAQPHLTQVREQQSHVPVNQPAIRNLWSAEARSAGLLVHPGSD